MIEKQHSDPAEHAKDFAHRWVDRLETAVEGRMHVLNLHDDFIGTSDHAHGVEWRTFFPHEHDGGNVTAVGRINVDSGVLNPELLTEPYGDEAAQVWQNERLRNRIDAIIIHELSEFEAESHEGALALAPRTVRPITQGTRKILRAMELGWKGR